MSSVRHVYALFDDSEEAAAAYREVQERGCRAERCSLLMQRDHLDEEELFLGETAAREGAKKGAFVLGATGAVLGGIAGIVGIPAGLIGFGPLVGVLFGAGTGSAYGALLGAIAGAAEPAKQLRNIEGEVKAGKTLVAIETDDPEIEQTCAEVFAAHGGMQLPG